MQGFYGAIGKTLARAANHDPKQSTMTKKYEQKEGCTARAACW